MHPAVKLLQETPTGFTVGGYGVIWGGKDLASEHFDREATDFWFDRLTQTPMVLYQHGLDGKVKRTVVGRVTTKTEDDIGLWIEAQIDANKQYVDAIRKLVKKGVLGWSSGAVSHLVDKDASGKILSWPVAEWSLTPTPCEPRTLGAAEIRSLVEVEPALKAVLPVKAEQTTEERNALDDGDFAYIDSDGGRHLPVNDEAHVRNAMARFSETHFESEEKKKAAARKILARARKYDIEISPDSAVSEAAKFYHLLMATWYPLAKALMEGSDSAGGFATDGDGDEDGGAAPTGQEHPHEAMAHEHTHANGLTHSHPHHHGDGSVDHDSEAHSHEAPIEKGPTSTTMAGKALDDYEGSFEDLREDLTRLINANPFASGYNSVVATYADHAIVCCYEPDGDECYLRVDFVVGDDGEPKITGSSEVEQAWVPSKEPMKGFGPLTLDAGDAMRRARSLVTSTQGLYARRVKEGRVLSAANRKLIGDAADAMAKAVDALRALLDASEAARTEAAKAAFLGSDEAKALDQAILDMFATALEDVNAFIPQ